MNNIIYTSAKSFEWPNGEMAAVCLTYDDGLDCHLDVVKPDLDRYGFKGSFYLTGNSLSLKERPHEWVNLAKTGHEIGNHSLFHPCDGLKFDWVKPRYDLRDYDVEDIVDELSQANVLLNFIDRQTERTYAFTCGNYQVGDKVSFVDAIRPLFSACRCDGSVPLSMHDVDLHFMPSWMVDEHSGDDMINYVNQAAAHGTIATIMFHSVQGPYLNVSRQAHMELLKYLDSNRDKFWVGTFKEITNYIREQRKTSDQTK